MFEEELDCKDWSLILAEGVATVDQSSPAVCCFCEDKDERNLIPREGLDCRADLGMVGALLQSR